MGAINTLSVGDTFVDGSRVMKVQEIRDDGMVISTMLRVATSEDLATVTGPEVTSAPSAAKRRARSK